jgi:hypothetical protein
MPFDVVQYNFLPYLNLQDTLHLQEAVKFSLPLQRRIPNRTLVQTLSLFVIASIDRRMKEKTIHDIVWGLTLMGHALKDLLSKSSSEESIQRFMDVYDQTLRDNLATLREALLGIPSRLQTLQVADKYELQQAELTMEQLLSDLVKKRNAYYQH